MSARNAIRNGFGWLLIARRAKLSVWRSERGPKPLHADCGPLFRPSIANVPSATPIFGRRMPPSCHRNGIARSERKVVKPVISSGSTIPCGNGVVDWFERHSLSRKNWRIISAPSGTSSTTITHGNAQNAISLPLHDYREHLSNTLEVLYKYSDHLRQNILQELNCSHRVTIIAP